jgi:DNA polymerase V
LLVWVQTNSFKPTERQYSASKAVRLPVVTTDTGKLIAAATAGLGIIFKPGYRYKKAGVTFLDLVPSDRLQGGLFDRARRCALDRSHARGRPANARFGRGAVGFGTAGVRHSWGLRRDFVSPRYTTVWDELLRV